MIILANTTDILQVVLAVSATTNQLPVIISYRDITTTTFVADRQITETNGTTAVDVVNAPAASTQRVIDYINIRNIDTKAHYVTILYNANGTTYILFKVLLNVNENILYQSGEGFTVYNSVGGEKTILEPSLNNLSNDVAGTWYGGILGEDRIIKDIRMQEIEGLSFSLVPNAMYYFQAYFKFTSNATGTGAGICLRKKSTENNLLFLVTNTNTATSTTALGYYISNETENPVVSPTSVAATTSNIAYMEGFIKANTLNTDAVQIAFAGATELITGTMTVLAGSTFQLLKIT